MTSIHVIRQLPPLETNLKKRLVKSPKVYIRDSGILHALLEIETFDQLMGHPIVGASWEGFALETLINSFSKGRFSFFRTSNGQEVDCIYERQGTRFGFDVKLSSAPKLSRGTTTAITDLNLDHLFVVATVRDTYRMKENVTVSGILGTIRAVEQLLVT